MKSSASIDVDSLNPLNANDSVQSELNGNDLTAGPYTYTLMVNGKISLSKPFKTLNLLIHLKKSKKNEKYR